MPNFDRRTTNGQPGLSVRRTSNRLLISAATRAWSCAVLIVFGLAVMAAGAIAAGICLIAVAALGTAAARGRLQAARRFRIGARAEENVGARLNRLEFLGWEVEHDVQKAGVGNIDHVVHAPGVTFTIDTKASRCRERDIDQAHRHATWALRHYGTERPIVPVICVDAADLVPVVVRGVSIVGGENLGHLLQEMAR